MLNFTLLGCLELVKKFVVVVLVVGGWVVCKPILVFSFDFGQAEQLFDHSLVKTKLFPFFLS